MSYQEKLRFWAPFLVFIILGFLLYAKVLNGEFVSDDYDYIVNNPAVRDLGNLPAIWQSFNTRFLTGLSFALNYRLGGLDVWGYHLVNIAIHVLVVLQVFLLVQVLFETPALRKTSLYADRRWLAFYAALIFLCHPVQTQAVSFITQRAVAAATLFYLSAIILYLKARIDGRGRYLWGAALSMLAGLFTKEMVVTLPVTLAVCEFYFFPGQGAGWWRTCRRLLPFFLLSALVPLSLLMDRPASVLSLGQQVQTGGFSWRYFMTELSALCTHLRLLVLPFHQHHVYDFKIAESFWQMSILLSALVLSALAGLGAALFTRQRLMSFAVVWFFVTISVETMVVCVVRRAILFEHWLYMPMAGFAIFVIVGMRQFFSDRAAFQRAAVMIVAILSLLTFMRNDVWRTEIGFWQDGVRKTPRLPTVYYGLGHAYQRRGLYDLARQAYQQPLEICERSLSHLSGSAREMCSGIYSNLGIISIKSEKASQALEYFIRAVRTDPANARARNNLAKMFFDLRKFPEAIAEYRQSLALQMDYPDAHFYLGQALWFSGDQEQAKEELQKAQALYRQFGQSEDVELVRQRIRELQEEQP